LNQHIEALFGAQPRLTADDFDRCFLEYYSRIVAVAYRLTADADEAEDLASETFWKLWQDPPRRHENLAGWLYRVVTHLGYNRLRSLRRRSYYEEHAGRIEVTAASLDEPEMRVIRNQERSGIRSILRDMPRRDVQILLLRNAGLSYKELAEALKVAPGSIGTLIARAERKFEMLYSRGERDAPER
jgi:RNA polymerase sigma-70 factor (ECF subfamily)